MKRIYTLLLTFVFPMMLFAQVGDLNSLPDLFNGTKICLDPGHGGHDGDDRETDIGYSLTYWESDGVFAQANYAAEILEALGADVMVTRYTNDTHDLYTQPTLSERVAMANAFDADFFQSIHTNGNIGASNYVMTIYRGSSSGVPENAENEVMCELMKDEIAKVVNYDQTNSPVAKSDYQVTGGAYHFGVLNGTAMTAMLSEAAFHDYKVEGRRLNTPNYQKALAYTYVKSHLKYFDLGIMPVGEIGGKINFADGSEANEVKVSLLKDGAVIATQFSDIGHNGYYFFDLLTEGDYSLNFEKDGFTTVTLDNVQVTNGEYSQKDIQFATSPVVVESNAPDLIFVGTTTSDGVEAKWIKSDLEGLTGYKLYYSTDYSTWNLVADESTLNADALYVDIENGADFADPLTGEAKYFKLIAVGSSGNSAESEIYVKSKLSGSKKILLVDGYEGVSGDEEVDNSVSLQYLTALSSISSVGEIHTARSNYLSTSSTDLKSYDIVIWISAFEDAEDENFAGNERSPIREFMKSGGNLLVSGSNIGYDLKLNGERFSEQDFYTDYLKAKYSSADSGSKIVNGVANSIFNGLSFSIDESAVVNFPDAMEVWGGSDAVVKYNNNKVAAIGYRGGFESSIKLGRLLHFGFPLEALSNANLVTVLTKSNEYFDEFVELPAPPKPATTNLSSISPNAANDGVKLKWSKNTSDYVKGYNIYYSDNVEPYVWKLAVDYNSLLVDGVSAEIKFSSLGIDEGANKNLVFKLNAVAFGNDKTTESDDSRLLPFVGTNGSMLALVVDGFDRGNGGADYSSSNLLAVNSRALSENLNIKSVSTCTNDAIISGEVNLNSYHSVFWILGEESTADETFSVKEQTHVKEFLENGGSLFVSGAEIGWDLDNKGTVVDKAFYADYLKADYVNDGNSSYVNASGITGSVFDGVTVDFSVLWGVGYPDVIKAVNDGENIFEYQSGTFSGVSYKGKFGSSTINGGVVYLSFPIETANESDIKKVFDTAIDFFSELAVASPPVAIDDEVNTTEGFRVLVDVVANDIDEENNIDDKSIVVTSVPQNGTAVIVENRVEYTPKSGFVGVDEFEYTVSDYSFKSSHSATVSVSVNEKKGLPFETEIDPEHPKRDLRSVFLTTAYSIDFPKSQNSSWQQNNLIKYVDGLNEGNANAVFFQVRPAADAFYNSNIEPWSSLLTGTQGKDPGYDPLQFTIDQAHKKGIELHAWLNPYRTHLGSVILAANHVENTHPEWLMVYDDGHTILNPGIPAVTDYIVSIVDDIVSRYDVDGIHFDDYFYHYGGTPEALDAAEYELYNPDGLSLDDWRRNNINNMIESVYNKIQEVNTEQNKNIVLGISPFGIWKPGVPEGISTTATSAYDELYADAVTWMEGDYVDYVAPQLYWRIGRSGLDYKLLTSWWNDQAAQNNKFNYVSQAVYRMKENGWPVTEVQNQISYNREEDNRSTLGQVFYHTSFFTAPTDADGYKSLRTVLLGSQYKYPSVTASYLEKEKNVPNTPTELSFANGEISWISPGIAADSDTARRYIVYKFNSMEELITDKHNGRRIVAVTGETSMVVPDSWLSYGENFIAVTALDKNNNESEFSNVVVVDSRPVYCEAKGLNSSSEWINSVSIHSAENNSGNNNGYADFTNKIFTMQIGAETEVKLAPGFSGSVLNQHWKVFIDFNNDGDFSDSGETIIATTSSASSMYSEYVTIPTSAMEGVYRMRVMMSGNSTNNIDACSDINNGEVEDYLVNLIADELSIDEAGNEMEGVAFPNPFNNKLNFNLVSESKGNMELVIYNINGQVVYRKTMPKIKGENNFTIDSSEWANGVYLMLVRDENSMKSVYELIKN